MPEIGLKKIKPNRLNPRLEFTKLGLDELSDSIKKSGIIEPLIVRPVGKDSYEVVVGERRYRAAQQAGLDKISVIIREYSDDEVGELNIIENVQRENLTDIEKGNCVNELMKRAPKKYPTLQSVADMIGVSANQVSRWIKSTELPKQVQKMVAPPETLERGRVPKGKITADVAHQIRIHIDKPERQIEVARALAEAHVPWRAAREVVKEVAKKPQKPVEEIVKKIAEAPYRLPFRLSHKELILKEVKTQTSRKGIPDPKVKVGAIVHAAVWEPHFADLRITSIERKRLGDFTEEDTKREGGYTLKEFKEVWKKLHEEWNDNETVYVIRFKLVEKK